MADSNWNTSHPLRRQGQEDGNDGGGTRGENDDGAARTQRRDDMEEQQQLSQIPELVAGMEKVALLEEAAQLPMEVQDGEMQRDEVALLTRRRVAVGGSIDAGDIAASSSRQTAQDALIGASSRVIDDAEVSPVETDGDEDSIESDSEENSPVASDAEQFSPIIHPAFRNRSFRYAAASGEDLIKSFASKKPNLYSRPPPLRTYGPKKSQSGAQASPVTTTRISSMASPTTSSSIPRPASLSTATCSTETKIQSKIPRYNQSSPSSSPVTSPMKLSSGISSVSPDRSLSPMEASPPLSSPSSRSAAAGSLTLGGPSGSKPGYNYKRSDTYTKEVDVPEKLSLELMKTMEPLEEEEREGPPKSVSASSPPSASPFVGNVEGPMAQRQKFVPSAEMQGALKVLNDALLREKTTEQVTSAISVILHEWFRVAGTKSANAGQVEDYVDSFEVFSPQLLRYVVNMPDGNGNTALHYSVSHGNFDVVSILLDSKVCDPNKANKAGYTCIMLVALARIENDAHRQVITRLLKLGNVNTRGIQYGRTTLMLAASSGNLDVVELLVEAGADLEIRDRDGSTALMYAAERGNMNVARYLVWQHCCPERYASLADNDGSTAINIANQGGYKGLGAFLYKSMHPPPPPHN